MGEGFPTTRQYFLSVSVYPIVSARVVQLNALFIDKDGMIIPVTVTTPVTVAGIKSESEIQCIDGKLISVTVSDVLGTAKEGEVYCEAAIKIGQTDTRSPLAILARGYVFENFPIFHPGGNDRGPSDGDGLFYHATQADPGAGNSFSLTFEARESVRVLSACFTFTADVNVATRYILLTLNTDSGIYLRVQGNPNPAATQVIRMEFTQLNAGVTGSTAVRGNIGIQRHSLFRYPVKALELSAVNMQAGDTFTSIILSLEKYADLRGF